jgi:hypothetical protein
MDHRRPQSRRTPTPQQDRLDQTAQAVTMAFARHERARGRSLAEVARELSLPVGTLRRWLTASSRVFRPVAVVAAPRSGDARLTDLDEVPRLVVVTAHGHRVEGLDLAGVLAVVRALEAGA